MSTANNKFFHSFQSLMKIHTNKNTLEKPEHTETEHPVYITTFKSVQNEDGETTIQSENTRISQKEGIVVEEVLSDTEPILEDTTQSNIEITEVSEPTGDFLKIFLIHLQTKYTYQRNLLLELSKSSEIRA